MLDNSYVSSQLNDLRIACLEKYRTIDVPTVVRFWLLSDDRVGKTENFPPSMMENRFISLICEILHGIMPDIVKAYQSITSATKLDKNMFEESYGSKFKLASCQCHQDLLRYGHAYSWLISKQHW